MNLGYAVTDIAEGEWTRYWVQSPSAENYTYPLSLRVAGWAGTSRSRSPSSGQAGSVDLALPYTGSATSYGNVTSTLRLAPGMNIVRLTYHGNAMNFDYFTLDPSGAPPVPTPTPTPTPTRRSQARDRPGGAGTAHRLER